MGLCRGHYEQQHLGKELRPLGARRGSEPNEKCLTTGCKDEAETQGYCPKDYARMMRTGQLEVIRPGAASEEHGASMYGNHGCRCDICKAGHAEKMAEAKARRFQAPREEVPHGPSGYKNWGCHCGICVQGHRDSKKVTA